MQLGDAPTPVRWAGISIAIQGAVGLVAAAVLVVRALGGHHEDFASGYGLALWCALIGLAVLAGGLALLRGKRWGRGIGVVAELLLLPVAYALMTDSGRPHFGIPLAIWAFGTLVALFTAPALEWAAGDLPPDAN
ncbi:MAG: hypothetical protein QM728_10925 [Gordonia sp. (in: high G+C Gram-positive bacteria)]|uniref:hypothetical protein n=1 Tax=Gordonia sp. (in: high G+C Gram-positive bacteria) TaxID=84139 RepID=UPI0039E22A8C